MIVYCYMPSEQHLTNLHSHQQSHTHTHTHTQIVINIYTLFLFQPVPVDWNLFLHCCFIIGSLLSFYHCHKAKRFLGDFILSLSLWTKQILWFFFLIYFLFYFISLEFLYSHFLCCCLRILNFDFITLRRLRQWILNFSF